MTSLSKITSKSAVIGVVGLGYVGLPLILAYVRAGFHVIGFDIDETKISALTAGRSYIQHIPTAQVAAAQASGRLAATADFTRAHRQPPTANSSSPPPPSGLACNSTIRR